MNRRTLLVSGGAVALLATSEGFPTHASKLRLGRPFALPVTPSFNTTGPTYWMAATVVA